MTMLLAQHGYIGCRACFTGNDSSLEFSNADSTKWRLEQPNAAWGSQTPQILVLGFSRGANQSKLGTPFDEIAFKGMRKQLSDLLRSLRLLGAEPIDAHINAGEQKFAFGSLIRCSVAQWDQTKLAYSKAGGAILQKFAKGSATLRVATTCVGKYLTSLPAKTKLIVMLGNEERYIRFCFERVKEARGQAKWVNAMAYDSLGVRFVHIMHAKAQGSLVPDWVAGVKSQVEKRRHAVEAVDELLTAIPGLEAR
jgi:hypothetical protein